MPTSHFSDSGSVFLLNFDFFLFFILLFTVLLDDVAGGADNVVVVRSRAQPVSEPADTGRTVPGGGGITSAAGNRSGGLLLPVLLHMEVTVLTRIICLVSSESNHYD